MLHVDLVFLYSVPQSKTSFFGHLRFVSPKLTRWKTIHPQAIIFFFPFLRAYPLPSASPFYARYQAVSQLNLARGSLWWNLKHCHVMLLTFREDHDIFQSIHDGVVDMS